jgi:hypothetical protein
MGVDASCPDTVLPRCDEPSHRRPSACSCTIFCVCPVALLRQRLWAGEPLLRPNWVHAAALLRGSILRRSTCWTKIVVARSSSADRTAGAYITLVVTFPNFNQPLRQHDLPDERPDASRLLITILRPSGVVGFCFSRSATRSLLMAGARFP